MRGMIAFRAAFIALFCALATSYTALSIMGSEVPAAVTAQVLNETLPHPEKKQPPAVVEFDFMASQSTVYRNTMAARYHERGLAVPCAGYRIIWLNLA